MFKRLWNWIRAWRDRRAKLRRVELVAMSGAISDPKRRTMGKAK